MSAEPYDGSRSRLGDCCQNHNPMTAPVVYPHRVWIDRDSLRGEYLCACGRHWPCWWGLRSAGWTLEDVALYSGSRCSQCSFEGQASMDGEWFHRGPCHVCASCGATACYVWNDSVSPEVHICDSGCDGMPPGLELAS